MTTSSTFAIAPAGVLAPEPDSPSIRFSPAFSRSFACLWNAVLDIRSWNAICSRLSPICVLLACAPPITEAPPAIAAA